MKEASSDFFCIWWLAERPSVGFLLRFLITALLGALCARGCPYFAYEVFKDSAGSAAPSLR